MRIALTSRSSVLALTLAGIALAHCNGDACTGTCSDVTTGQDVVTADQSTGADASIDTTAPTDVANDTQQASDTSPPTDVPAGTCSTTDLGMATGMPAAMGDTTSATNNQTASTDCGMSGGPDMAYAWRAPSAGSYVIDTAGTAHDTILYLRDGSCTGAELACNDDAPSGGGQSSVCVTATAGQSFLIIVDGYDSTARGPFVLNIASAAACP